MKLQTLKTYTATLFLGGFAATQAQAARPNIIFILADDLGYGDLSCYNADSKISTPNIDKLAADGMLFTDAHTSSALSTPSRYGLLTGRFCFRSKLKSGVLGKDAPPLIEANRTTVGGFLQQNGYNTACIGKWHLGMTWAKKNGQVDYASAIKDGPVTRGFDYYYGINTNTSPCCFIENDKTVGIPSVEKPEGMYGGAGLMVPGWTWEGLLPGLSDKAVEYIHNSAEIFKRDPEKPFFMYFASTCPHSPIAPTDEFKCTSKAHLYGDFIQELDHEVGRIVQAIKDQGIEDNTVIIFSSDNGPMHWDGTNMQGRTGSIFKYDHDPSYIFRGKKSDIWEAGHRVPFIVKWPAMVPANAVNNELISLVDFTATCAGILGTKLPEGAAEDSYNMLSAWTKTNTIPIRNELLNHSGRGMFALRKGDWKYIECGGSGGFTNPTTNKAAAELGWPLIQLYNMKDDPEETTNQQAAYPEKIIEMKAILDSIRKGRVNDPAGNIYAENVLEFDAAGEDSYVDCSAQTTFTPDNFTIELWANITGTVGGATILSNAEITSASNKADISKKIRDHKNAVLIKDDIWIRDPYIIRGPDSYFYLTGTTQPPEQPLNPEAKYNVGLGKESLVGSGVRAWRSKDLVIWDSLGIIYTLKDGVGPEIDTEKFRKTPVKQWRLWAPEFHFVNGKFTIIHTTPAPVTGSNFSFAPGSEAKGPWSNPMGKSLGHRHDPSLFQDDNGTWWMVYGYQSAFIAPLKKDMTGFAEEPVEIAPTGEMKKMGHEGCLILKIHGKYVLFGTGWSTQTGRKGSYNLYYATADHVKGPYSERRFAGRFLGHGTPFQDMNGKWWCTAFFNANVPPLDKKGIRTCDLRKNAYTINEQGVTIVPLEVRKLADGDVFIRATDPDYADPGPDEIQQFK